MTAPRPLLRNPSATAPLLLVSVRQADEARAAIAGGAAIIDVKEPSRGPLGWADEAVLDEVAQTVSTCGQGIPLTAALGEVRDWTLPAAPRVPQGFALGKLGLAGLSSTSDWIGRWRRLRDRIDQCAAQPLEWVAVAYADVRQAEAPPVEEVLQAGVETGCRGLLIDTFTKDRGRLTDFLSFEQLESIAELAHQQGLFLAVAGRLRIDDLARFANGPADIVGVRSAACIAGDRSSNLCEQQTRRCRQTLSGRTSVTNACQ